MFLHMFIPPTKKKLHKKLKAFAATQLHIIIQLQRVIADGINQMYKYFIHCSSGFVFLFILQKEKKESLGGC